MKCNFGINGEILNYGLIFQSYFHMFNVHDSFHDISEANLHREGYFRSSLHLQYHCRGLCQSLRKIYCDTWECLNIST